MSEIRMQENKSSNDKSRDTYDYAADLKHNTNLLQQMKALGLPPDPELLRELAGGSFQKLLRESKEVELKPAGEFPSLKFEQAMAYKNIQKQLKLGKSCESQKAYKTKIEDLDAVYRGGLSHGLLHGVGEAVTFWLLGAGRWQFNRRRVLRRPT